MVSSTEDRILEKKPIRIEDKKKTPSKKEGVGFYMVSLSHLS